jgi:Ca-activated chloride channel family protein
VRVPLRKTPPKAKPQKFTIHFPLAVSLLLAAGNISTSSAQNEIPPIRVDVNVVSVPVTINNARGEFVGGLRRENFHLRVDGKDQPIAYFAAEDEPAQVLLLVETGPAVYLLRDEHTSAAAVLLSGLAPDDRVAVASYEQAPRLLADFSADKQTAAAALNTLVFSLGTAQLDFYDSLAICIDWLSVFPGKRAIVALTTGIDGSGPDRWQALAEKLQRSNVMVLPVALGRELRGTAQPRNSKTREQQKGRQSAKDIAAGFAQFDGALTTIADETGGHAFFPKSDAEFESAYRQIAALLRHEYDLGFNAGVRDGAYHTIEVEVMDSRGESLNKDQKKPAYRWNSRRGFRALSP